MKIYLASKIHFFEIVAAFTVLTCSGTKARFQACNALIQKGLAELVVSLSMCRVVLSPHPTSIQPGIEIIGPEYHAGFF